MSMDAGRDVRGTGGNTSLDARSGTGGAVDAAVDSPPSTGGAGGASPGCGAGKTTSSCGKSGGTKCTLTSNSKTREYYLILPTSYNASKPYPVVIMLHGMIATAEMALSWFKEIPTNMPDAIYIAPQGLKHVEQGGGANGNEVTGWANVDGEDIQFMKDLLGAAQKDYCVDTQRAFAVGFSYGAMFSYAIGCELGGIFRAIAPMSGALLSGCNLSGKPVAMWGSHGTSDSLVPDCLGPTGSRQDPPAEPLRVADHPRRSESLRRLPGMRRRLSRDLVRVGRRPQPAPLREQRRRGLLQAVLARPIYQPNLVRASRRARQTRWRRRALPAGLARAYGNLSGMANALCTGSALVGDQTA